MTQEVTTANQGILHFHQGWGYIVDLASQTTQWLKDKLDLIVISDGDKTIIHSKAAKSRRALEEIMGEQRVSYFKCMDKINGQVMELGSKCYVKTWAVDGARVFWELTRFETCLPNSTVTLGKRFARYRLLGQDLHMPACHVVDSQHASQCKAAAKRRKTGGEASSSVEQVSPAVMADEPTCSTAMLLMLLTSGSLTKKTSADRCKAADMVRAILDVFLNKTDTFEGVASISLVPNQHVIVPATGVLADVPWGCVIKVDIHNGLVKPSSYLTTLRTDDRTVLKAFSVPETHVAVWLQSLFATKDNWLAHQIIFQLALHVERSWSRMNFTSDPLAADLPVLKTSKGRTRRIDNELLRAPVVDLVRTGEARSARVAFSVMAALARRKGLAFFNPRKAAMLGEAREMHSYLFELNRLFHDATCLHVCFDGVTVANEKTLNLLVGRPRLDLWAWLPPQVVPASI